MGRALSTPAVRAAFALALVAAFAAVSGCGHPATRDECEEIFQRSAEIELRTQNVTDPIKIQERIKEARTARGEELMTQCVGKRITSQAVACVKQASTAEQVDRCLD